MCSDPLLHCIAVKSPHATNIHVWWTISDYSPAEGAIATLNSQNVDLRTRELSEALDQQKATSEVLRVVASSPTNRQSALGMIAETAARLLDVTDAEIM